MFKDSDLKIKMSVLLPAMNEKQRRLLAGAEAISFGHGGIKYLSEITGMSRSTIRKGIEEIKNGDTDCLRIRKPGQGRKKITYQYPEVEKAIEKIIEPSTRGDPESPLRWTCKSIREISTFLKGKKYDVSYRTVARILHIKKYSLQGNAKTKEGKGHPDRDRQFRFINNKCKRFISNGNPVISVDTKKKELVGDYKNPGREWRPKGSPLKVKTHDFPDKDKGKANPYGVFDIANNTGFVNVGITADTAEFAVSSIRYWWKYVGKRAYPSASVLYICADAGGSNSYRSRLWKKELQRFSNRTKLDINVSHYPPGTSKWNKIEHRLFSFISIKWRGRPLTTYQTIIDLIAATKTDKGLTVKSRLDRKTYAKGIKVSDGEMEKLNIVKSSFHGDWNYKIKPSLKLKKD